MSDNATPAAAYASEFGYAPHGALAELKLGNNLYEYRDYNTRLQPQEIGLGTFSGGSDKLKLQFKYGESNNNNGNVLKQIITRPSLTALTQTYTYDKVNRLKTAAESGAGTAFSRSYGYDRYGNRAVTANSGLPTSPLMPTATTNFSTSTNRLTLTGAGYDNSGNLTATSLGETLAYDAENRLASYTLSSATTSYKYGPQGRRVRKVTPTVTETYVYDAFGKLAAEYSTVAPTAGGTFYRTPDHLGSTRLVTKQDKSDADCYDYAPFGEEIPNTLGGRSSNACFAASFDGRYQFTGQERDDESDLDYFLARYYSRPMGRFLSPDPTDLGVLVTNPATWNSYTYTYNRPLTHIDNNGLWPTWAHNRIINRAFPGLSHEERAILEKASYDADYAGDAQASYNAYKHGMRDGSANQTSIEAQARYEAYTKNLSRQAKKEQGRRLRGGTDSLDRFALETFGELAHAVSDSFSPSHVGFQAWHGFEWSDFITDTQNATRAAEHFFGEEQLVNKGGRHFDLSIRELQLRFLDVFGQKQFERATKKLPPQQSLVTIRIKYKLEEDDN